MPIVELASHDDVEGVCWIRWRFELDPTMVWEGLTDPIWLRRWLGRGSGEFVLGGAVEVLHGRDTVPQRSVVRACEPGRRLEVTWDVRDEPLSVVDVRLAPAASGTELTLTHLGLGEHARDYAIVWHAHLLYLAAALWAAPMDLERFWDVHERVSRAYAGR